MPLYAGGGMGVLAAIRLSDEVNVHAFKFAFGTLLISYVVYMIGRRSAAVRSSSGSILSTSAVGFAGGLVGGFTAMPSAVPTLWCDLRGIAKEEQRGILQPYMTAMQALSIVLLLAHEGAVDADFPRTFMTAFPLTIAGSWLGLRFFARFDEQRFRCVVLLLILLSGIALLR